VTSCAGCAFVYEDLAVERVPERLREIGPNARAALGDIDPKIASTRPEQTVWSALEYACHLRDVLLIQRERVVLALVEERPHPAPMWRDERVTICRYDAQSLADVLDQLAMAGDLCALAFEGLVPAGWARQLVYSWPTTEVRDLAWVGRHTVHEGIHHLGDIGRVLATVGAATGRSGEP
jgi:S-DNA-T family DNA segregation ATPase FtsK/SpoIIIE